MVSCRTIPYEKLTLDLGTARDGTKPNIIEGEQLYVRSISSGARLTVKLNKESADEIPLNESGGLRIVVARFERLYFTNLAQSTKSAELWILRKGIRFAGPLDTLSAIRDVLNAPKSFFVNPNAEQDFVGWYNLYAGDVEIEVGAYATMPYGLKCWRFPADKECAIAQCFPIPLGVDWLESFFCYLRCSDIATNCMKLFYIYTDGTTSSEFLTVSDANVWQKEPLSPTAGKKIQEITFYHDPDWAFDTYLDAIFTVF